MVKSGLQYPTAIKTHLGFFVAYEVLDLKIKR